MCSTSSQLGVPTHLSGWLSCRLCSCPARRSSSWSRRAATARSPPYARGPSRPSRDRLRTPLASIYPSARASVRSFRLSRAVGRAKESRSRARTVGPRGRDGSGGPAPPRRDATRLARTGRPAPTARPGDGRPGGGTWWMRARRACTQENEHGWGGRGGRS